MLPVLNSLGISAALYGNVSAMTFLFSLFVSNGFCKHDFDFGIETLEKLAGQSNFPWLISNAFDIHSKKVRRHPLSLSVGRAAESNNAAACKRASAAAAGPPRRQNWGHGPD